VVELAIIRGIRRTALHGGLIKSVFLMYFHLYIYLNITLLPKLRFKTPGSFEYINLQYYKMASLRSWRNQSKKRGRS
jgi:hypothetical protein